MFANRCQRRDLIGEHSLVARARDRVRMGLGIRSGLQRLLAEPDLDWRPGRGAPSRFAVGQWVRVRDQAAIRATLDAKDKLRGLAFVPAQWATCGRVFQVSRHVRQLVDDAGHHRAVARTVLLDGADCSTSDSGPGCGRFCPLMYRDEWLEDAEPPATAAPTPRPPILVTVRSLAEIRATLDVTGRCDWVTFTPEMARHAGRRLVVRCQLPRVLEHERWVAPPHPLYLLECPACSGDGQGGCDRECALVWHERWLRF